MSGSPDTKQSAPTFRALSLIHISDITFQVYAALMIGGYAPRTTQRLAHFA